MQNNRKTITAGDLYVILDREFRSRQSKDCGSCYILLPYRVDTNGDGESANWEVILPPECAYGCIRIVEDLVYKYSDIYQLAEDDGKDD